MSKRDTLIKGFVKRQRAKGKGRRLPLDEYGSASPDQEERIVDSMISDDLEKDKARRRRAAIRRRL